MRVESVRQAKPKKKQQRLGKSQSKGSRKQGKLKGSQGEESKPAESKQVFERVKKTCNKQQKAKTGQKDLSRSAKQVS